MVEIVDDLYEAGDESEAVDNQLQPSEPVITPEAPPVDDVPEKYKGKAIQDVIKMHQEAERLASRHAQEVGEVRKLADQLIKSQISQPPEKEPDDKLDFFDNPEEAVRRSIESNPIVKATQEYALLAQRAQIKREFDELHPDAGQIVNDPAFNEWVTASKIRTALYKQAVDYDLDAGNELFSTFKQLRKVAANSSRADTSEADRESRSSAIRAASVDVGGAGETTKKRFSRQSLIRMQITDPAKYEANQDEIALAYREGRVY